MHDDAVIEPHAEVLEKAESSVAGDLGQHEVHNLEPPIINGKGPELQDQVHVPSIEALPEAQADDAMDMEGVSVPLPNGHHFDHSPSVPPVISMETPDQPTLNGASRNGTATSSRHSTRQPKSAERFTDTYFETPGTRRTERRVNGQSKSPALARSKAVGEKSITPELHRTKNQGSKKASPTQWW